MANNTLRSGIVRYGTLALVPVVLGACSMTAPDVASTYSLVSFNDQPLPAVVTATGTSDSRSTLEVLGWELTLAESGQFSTRALFRRTVNGQPMLDSTVSQGHYDFNAYRVILRSSTGERRTFRIQDDGDKLTSAPSPGDWIHGVAQLDILVFRRGRLGTT